MKTRFLATLLLAALAPAPLAAQDAPAAPLTQRQQRELDRELLQAVAARDTRLQQGLLAQGADASALVEMNGNRHSPLHAAAVTGHVPSVRLLLQHGADPKLVPAEGSPYSPLAVAVQQAHYLGTKLMLVSRPWSAEELAFAFKTAVAQHCEPIADLLRRHGADPNAPLFDGSSSLAAVTQAPGGMATLRYLLRAGLDLSHPTPWVALCAQGVIVHAEAGCAGLLLEAGYPVNAADPQGDTVLSFAALSRDRAKVTWLLEHGADPRVTNRYGLTLTEAANGGEAITQMLRERAAQLDAEGRALPPDMPAPLELSPLYRAVRERDADTLRRLLAEGADVNERQPETGDSPLILATIMREDAIIRLLMEHGADPWIRNKALCTAFNYAVYHDSREGSERLTSLLLPRGLDGLNGQQLYDLAYNSSYGKVPTLLRRVLDTGAIEPDSAQTATLLFTATWAGNLDIARMLVEYGADPERVVSFGKYAAKDYAAGKPGFRELFAGAQREE